MIVSASYKTDIPAFYGRWFMARVKAGHCRMTNPYGGQVYEIPLGLEAVDGFVFWTKNLRPFQPALGELRRQGYAFTIQYTVTGLPRALEPAVPDWRRAVEDLHAVSETHGPRVAVWRYDPILVTNVTPAAWHRDRFATLARAIEGAVDEVVVSFTGFYAKTRRNLAAVERQAGIRAIDPPGEEKRGLVQSLAQIAAAHGMRLTLCTQPELVEAGLPGARCIDGERLAAVAGRSIRAETRGNRPGCHCQASRDIGAYDTCPHGCAYCYAVQSPALAKRRHRAHDGTSPSLERA
jgi:Domain of unknown function (DUF1848)